MSCMDTLMGVGSKPAFGHQSKIIIPKTGLINSQCWPDRCQARPGCRRPRTQVKRDIVSWVAGATPYRHLPLVWANRADKLHERHIPEQDILADPQVPMGF